MRFTKEKVASKQGKLKVSYMFHSLVDVLNLEKGKLNGIASGLPKW